MNKLITIVFLFVFSLVANAATNFEDAEIASGKVTYDSKQVCISAYKASQAVVYLPESREWDSGGYQAATSADISTDYVCAEMSVTGGARRWTFNHRDSFAHNGGQYRHRICGNEVFTIVLLPKLSAAITTTTASTGAPQNTNTNTNTNTNNVNVYAGERNSGSNRSYDDDERDNRSGSSNLMNGFVSLAGAYLDYRANRSYGGGYSGGHHNRGRQHYSGGDGGYSSHGRSNRGRNYGGWGNGGSSSGNPNNGGGINPSLPRGRSNLSPRQNLGGGSSSPPVSNNGGGNTSRCSDGGICL